MAAGNVMAGDATWTATTVSNVVTDSYFPMVNGTNLNLTAFGTNAFDDATKTITFKYCDANNKDYVGGVVGWEVYDQTTNGWWNQSKSVDFTTYSYLVVQLNKCPGFFQELQYTGTTGTTTSGKTTYTDATYGMTLGSEKSDHCSVSTTGFVAWDNATYKMNNVMRLRLRDGATNVSDPSGASADNCGQLQLSNIFLTNTLPSWDAPVTKTPKANYGTVCLPYTATVAGAYIYQITGKSTDGKTLYIAPYNGLLNAGVPYLYKALTAATAVNFYEIKSGTEATATTNNGLVGMYNDKAPQGDYYVLSNDTWYKVNSDVTVKNGAYLNLSGVSGSSAKGSIALPIEDGEATGINEATTAVTTDANAVTYDLSGRKVSADTKGLVIRNNKKFINK